MGSKEEWQSYQEAIRSGDKERAAEAFRRYLDAKKAEGKGGSRPFLVSLGTSDRGYSSAIPLESIPDEMERNPEFFDLMRRVSGGKDKRKRK